MKHAGTSALCPLYSEKQASVGISGMSAIPLGVSLWNHF